MSTETQTATELELVTLYRPVGQTELDMIRYYEFRAFPPRWPTQPLFYPLATEQYATEVAQTWDAQQGGHRVGYVLRFQVSKAYLERYDVQLVGRRYHQEYWVPAEELDAFNQQIVGSIEVIAEYHGDVEGVA